MVGFDSATVRSDDGQTRTLTPDDFYRLPLAERVRLICNGAVKFFKDGRSVPATDAIKRS